MAEDLGIDVLNPDPMDIIRGWQEKGLTKDTILVRGVSVGSLIDTARTGIVRVLPSHQYDLDYQKALVGNQGYLYYFYPIFNNLVTVCPTVLENRLEGNGSLQNPPYHMGLHHALTGAQLYALYADVKEHFKTLTGIEAETGDILYLASQRHSKLFDRQIDVVDNYYVIAGDQFNGHTQKAELLKRTIPEDKLVPALLSSLGRRGVLIYFNKHTIEFGDLQNDPETDYTLLLHTKKPLPTSTIDGVCLLSKDADLAA